jgi:AsmA protein
MKAVKILISLIVLVVIVCAFALGSLVYFVDPNKLKPLIVAKVKNDTGYLLSIDGKLSWSFYPHIAIKIDHAVLTAPNKKQIFADAYDVRLATDLSDIFHASENLHGNLWIANAKLKGVKLEEIAATLDLNHQHHSLTVSDIKAWLYGGKLEGSIIGRNMSALPQWQWDMKCNDIQIKPFLQDANGQDATIKISGTGFLMVQGETLGKTREETLSHLNGKGEFNLKDGNIEGVDLNYYIQMADVLLNKKSNVQAVNDKQTSFRSLTGSFVINDGVANISNAILVAPSFMAKAQGNIGLLTDALALSLQIKPELPDVKINIDIPVLVKGDINHPELRLDMLALQKDITVLEIQNVKDKAIKQIQKHVPGQAGEFLQKLLSR